MATKSLRLVTKQEAANEHCRLRELLEEHDRAEETLRRTRAEMRPLMRAWADERRQLTIATIEQVRRELKA